MTKLTRAQLLALYEDNPVIDAAESAVRLLGGMTRDKAEQVLNMWTYRREMTEQEAAAVLARFEE